MLERRPGRVLCGHERWAARVDSVAARRRRDAQVEVYLDADLRTSVLVPHHDDLAQRAKRRKRYFQILLRVVLS